MSANDIKEVTAKWQEFKVHLPGLDSSAGGPASSESKGHQIRPASWCKGWELRQILASNSAVVLVFSLRDRHALEDRHAELEVLYQELHTLARYVDHLLEEFGLLLPMIVLAHLAGTSSAMGCSCTEQEKAAGTAPGWESEVRRWPGDQERNPGDFRLYLFGGKCCGLPEEGGRQADMDAWEPPMCLMRRGLSFLKWEVSAATPRNIGVVTPEALLEAIESFRPRHAQDILPFEDFKTEVLIPFLRKDRGPTYSGESELRDAAADWIRNVGIDEVERLETVPRSKA